MLPGVPGAFTVSLPALSGGICCLVISDLWQPVLPTQGHITHHEDKDRNGFLAFLA